MSVEYTASLQAKLPSGVSVTVDGNVADGMVLTAAANGITFREAEALLASAFAAVQQSFAAATA